MTRTVLDPPGGRGREATVLTWCAAGRKGPAQGRESGVSDDTTASKLAQAKKVVTEELFKSGTPEYDHRSHERAIEAERKAQAAYDEAHQKG
jgi:hypothetical protein